MKFLSLHCDYIKFKPLKKALKSAELESGEKKEKKVEEVLVVLTAVEPNDDSKENFKQYIENILDIAKQVKAKNIVLYPYAHLSSNLSKPDTAVKVLKDAEKELKKKKFKVVRAPFGFYKEFELKCKGHPLSELSRQIGSEKKETEGIEKTGIVEKEEKYDYKKLLKQVSKAKLDREKLKDKDHRILGQKMDLFSFNETAPGMVFWHNNGLIIYNELVRFWREAHKKAGYEEVSTPFILDKRLWQISGHWEKYKENIFLTKYEDRDFAVKPMNCPGGLLIYKSKPHTYKEFPIRVGELGIVHRQELSGVLSGLFRLIKFTQDDAHIFCANAKQVESEIEKLIDMIYMFYDKFNIKFDHIELSTRPEKRIGSDEIWDMAESILEKVLKKKKIKFKINKGDGAFYGPKIDFHLKDSQKRTWQLPTIQLDFAMPERFDLTYTDEKSNEKRPIMIHRVIYGALERFIGILLEETSGLLPTWLSPIQVRVINFTERNTDTCNNFIKQIGEQIPNIRLDADFTSNTVNSKIRDAEIQRIPYIIVIGDKEEENNTISVRKHGEKPKFGIKPQIFIQGLKQEIEQRL